MPRFFVDKENIEERKIHIYGKDAFHIARSLRMAVGDEVTVCDNDGTDYLCRLCLIRDTECECDITESKKSKSESPVDITLYMAYPKGDKLESVIQKATELGASKIVPFYSSRCIKRPPSEKAEKNTDRLKKIAEEAAKQSGRGRLPSVTAPIEFNGLLSEIKNYDISLFCYEGEGALSLKSVLASNMSAKTVSVIVGSEGGFSEKEAEAAVNHGAKCVNLGPRILRCETAPDYALSCISYFFEL